MMAHLSLKMDTGSIFNVELGSIRDIVPARKRGHAVVMYMMGHKHGRSTGGTTEMVSGICVGDAAKLRDKWQRMLASGEGENVVVKKKVSVRRAPKRRSGLDGADRERSVRAALKPVEVEVKADKGVPLRPWHVDAPVREKVEAPEPERFPRRPVMKDEWTRLMEAEDGAAMRALAERELAKWTKRLRVAEAFN